MVPRQPAWGRPFNSDFSSPRGREPRLALLSPLSQDRVPTCIAVCEVGEALGSLHMFCSYADRDV